MTLDATIRAVQAKLGVTVDGNPGQQTWNSIYLSLVREPPVSSFCDVESPAAMEWRLFACSEIK